MKRAHDLLRLSPALVGLILSACSGKSGPACQVGTLARSYVIKSVTLPVQASDFAVDLNGDGKLDNTYGKIVGAMLANGIDDQQVMDQKSEAGQGLVLVKILSSNASFTNDGCSVVTLQGALPTANPVFDGSGQFSPDPAALLSELNGTIQASTFAAEADADAKPVDFQTHLSFLGAWVPVTLVDAHVRIEIVGAGTVEGKIQGALENSTLPQIFDGIALAFNQAIAADPTGATSLQLLAIFDTGGAQDSSCPGTCMNRDGTCAVASDGTISSCEVSTNMLAKSTFAPDVQLFDAQGDFAPNPANTLKDSISVAFGFTAVPATF